MDKIASPQPETAKDWFEEGKKLKNAGDLAGALDAFRRSIKLNPRVAAPWIGLAQVLHANSQFEDARECLKRASAADPTNSDARLQLANAHKDLGFVEEAKREFDNALKLNPKAAAIHFGLGELLEDIGKPEAAADAYRSALQLEPPSANALANLLGLSRHVDVSSEIDQAHHRLKNSNRRDASLIGYGLGKALEQKKSYEEAFAAYAAANEARRETAGAFDPDAFDRRIADMTTLFSADFFESRKTWGDPSAQPVFIVGLPRSGTTLTEQIIGSHTNCFGAGELSVLTDLATSIPDRLGKADPPWPACARDLSDAQTAALGQDYLRQSATRAPRGALRVVDKQPLNFWHLGLVAIALPNARIIHCTRDIRDCGFSIFAHNFNPQQRWATDLGDIAHYWRGYRKLMAHWASVSGLKITNASYEETVSDVEGQSRRLLDFLDLPWEADVLRFHENDRAVQTPSRWQVRQPVYQSSKARWRRYENQLGSLIDAAENES